MILDWRVENRGVAGRNFRSSSSSRAKFLTRIQTPRQNCGTSSEHQMERIQRNQCHVERVGALYDTRYIWYRSGRLTQLLRRIPFHATRGETAMTGPDYAHVT